MHDVRITRKGKKLLDFLTQVQFYKKKKKKWKDGKIGS